VEVCCKFSSFLRQHSSRLGEFLRSLHRIFCPKYQSREAVRSSGDRRVTKYHRGMSRGQKVWIFGVVERESNRLKLFPVDNRNADQLLSYCDVTLGSTIYSDRWAAYNSLTSLGYRHFVVEHKHALKQVCTDAVTGEFVIVHTNTIEGCWKHAKAHFKRINGTKIEQFEGHLCEIIWRWWHKGSKVTGILNLIQEFYPLDRNPIMTAGHPVFRTWFQHHQASDNDSISRFDLSDNEQDTADESSQQTDEPISQQPEPSADVLHDRQQLASDQETTDTDRQKPNHDCTSSSLQDVLIDELFRVHQVA